MAVGGGVELPYVTTAEAGHTGVEGEEGEELAAGDARDTAEHQHLCVACR
jgi:hypothetical protein